MTNDRLYKNYFIIIYKYIDKKVIFISVIGNQSYKDIIKLFENKQKESEIIFIRYIV